MPPDSFSSCIINTVCSPESFSAIWRISAVKALRSASMFAGAVDHAREMLRVTLDPLRHIVIVAILPGPEPQHDQMQLVGARSVYQRIHVGPIELSWLWLNLFPID